MKNNSSTTVNSQKLSKAQAAKQIAEKKEQERIAIQSKKQQEEEQRQLQDQQDLKEFHTMPRIKLNLKSAFGLNENLKINKIKTGTTFHFLKTVQTAVNEVKVLQIVGRQLAIRDTETNDVQMLTNENFSHQISAITSHSTQDHSIIAMAESDYYDPSQLYFSVFEVFQGNQFRVAVSRVKIEIPEEDPISPSNKPEEIKTSRKGCEHHGVKKIQEFSSAVASSPLNRNNTIASVGRKAEAVYPFVSQICFSNDQHYLACLISGTVNRVIVYEWKAAKKVPVVNQSFNMSSFQEEISSPGGGEQSRFTDKSKVSFKTIYQQPVTQISFNPRHKLSLTLSGPNGLLEYRRIDIAQKVLETQSDSKFQDMRNFVMEVSDEVNITCHSWSEDAEYFGICTDQGHLVVYNVTNDIVLEEQHDDYQFVSIQLFELGLVAATNDGYMIFYELDAKNKRYREIRRWTYECDELKESLGDVIRGVQILDNFAKKMMAVQLSNRNILLIDVFNEVYFEDKRADILMKLQEHAIIQESPEEKSRLSILPLVELNKAKAAREKEKEAITAIDYKIVGNGFHSGSISEMHTCMQRPIILTMSHEDQTIRLWNYVDNICELQQNFALGLGGQKPLVSCALHPSGYYMAVALADQIRLYHILHPDTKQFNSYEIKNTKRIRFSAGGQYLCAVDHKNIHIFSTYSLERVRNLQIPPNTMNTIAFNFNDSRLVFISADGIVQNFDLNSFNRIGENRIDRAYMYKSAVFVSHEDPDNNEVITVGTQKDVSGSVRIYQGDEMVLDLKFNDEFGEQEPALCFNDIVKVVTAENLIENLVIGTNRGSVIVHGMPPRFLRENPSYRYGETVAHFGEVSALQASIDGRYVFSAGQDGIIFVYEVVEHTPPAKKGASIITNAGQGSSLIDGSGSVQSDLKKNSMSENIDTNMNRSQNGVPGTTTQSSKKGIEIQDELGRIVLVGKGLMEDWRKMQDTLRAEMEKQQDIVDSSLRAENFSFIQRNNTMEKKKTELLNKLNRDYEHLQMEEAEQKDENQQQMNKLEINHNACKEELQDLYEKKLEYEQEQFRKLKEAQNETKIEFENEIKRLNDRHDADVEELLNDFTVRLQDVQGMYEDSKKVADDLKMKNEEKLTSQEQDQLHEITELTREQKNVIDGYDKQISELKNNIERERYHKNKIQTEIKELQTKTDQIRHITEKLKKQAKDYEKTIKELDQDKKDATLNLKKKEDELFQQKFKIKDLQKTKQVLTHRTMEMKASLEPKEQQIESLKQNLHDLEKLFDMQAKSLFQMDQNVKAKEEARDQLDLKRKKAQVITKKHEHAIQDFVQDIQNTMQKQDDAEKIQGFMHIYKTHVKKMTEGELTKKQKDPEMIDELDKHLKYMEKQIRQLQDTSSKTLKKAKEHIHTRTEENKSLIENLSQLREKDKQRAKDQNEIDKKITQFQLQKRRIDTEIEKMKEEMQKMRLIDSQKPGMTRTSSVYTKKAEGDEKVAEQFRRSQSRGKLMKGSQWRNRPAAMYKKQIQEHIASLHQASDTIVMQQFQLATLKNEYMQVAQFVRVSNESQIQGEMQREQREQLQNDIQNFHMLNQAQQQKLIRQMEAQTPTRIDAEQPEHLEESPVPLMQDIDGQPAHK